MRKPYFPTNPNDPPPLKCAISSHVRFEEVDSMGIVWHGNYLRYFEEVRAELLDQINYGYFQMKESGYAWPIVDLKIKFIKPLKLQQTVKLVAKIIEYECQLKIQYEIFDKENKERLTKAYTTQVAIKMPDNEMCLTSPRILLTKLGVS